MNFDLQEAICHYRSIGAPADQSAVIALLREVQTAHGGSIPRALLTTAAEYYGVKEALFLAIIRRIPRLRLADVHVLEICAGPNCSRRGRLAQLAEQYRGRVEVKLVPCMRQCGKGPNLRFDGKLHHGADEQLLARLMEEIDK